MQIRSFLVAICLSAGAIACSSSSASTGATSQPAAAPEKDAFVASCVEACLATDNDGGANEGLRKGICTKRCEEDWDKNHGGSM